MKSSKSSPRARFQPHFFDFLCAGNLKAAVVIQRTPHCCLFLTTTCFDQLMFGLQARTKQTIFLRLLKGEGDEPGFFARVKAKKFARGKAMARRRLQRRCETKGRRLKTTPCTWSGLFHDELGEILREEASIRTSICAGTGLHVLPILRISCNLRCFCSSSSRSISLASTMLGCICRSLAMCSAGCKSTPCLVTMAEEKKHEVLFE